jgi:DNA-directed RNA polymerase specialized sigma24 family protein
MPFGTSTKPGGRRRSAIVEALNRDWDELVDRHRGSVRGWSRSHGALADCRSLTDVLVEARVEPDAVLAALLTEVSKGDQLAARVVLQVMLGRVLRMALRDPIAGVDDYVAALWIRICGYPLAARPGRIAANLSMDTLKAVSAEKRWLREGEVTPWPPEVFWEERHDQLFARPESGCLAAAAVLRAGRIRGVIDGPVHRLLVSVYIDELTGTEAAERHRTTAESVRVRCSRAVRRMAAHRNELLADVA